MSVEKVMLGVEVSTQTEALLEEIAMRGAWGVTIEEVAARFIDKVLVDDFVRFPIFKVTKGIVEEQEDE